MRSLPLGLTLLVAFVPSTAPVAARPAHVAPRLRIATPEDGSRVSEGRVRVVIVGEGGDGPGLFTLALDGQLVDTTGKVGGTFTTLSVLPGRQTEVSVRGVGNGDHELRLTQAADPDNTGAQQAPVVVRFTAVSGGGGAGTLALAGVVVAGAVAAVVAVRRRASEAAAAPPADRRGDGPGAA